MAKRTVRKPTAAKSRKVADTKQLRARLKRAEAALRASGERYDLAMRAIQEGIYDWNIKKGTIFYSHQAMEQTRSSPENSRTPEDWRRRIHPDDLPNYDRCLIAHFKGDAASFECDYRYRLFDGGWRWARQHGIAIRDKRGRAIRLIGSTGDITELKQGQERQAATAEILRVISKSTTDVQPVLETIAANARQLLAGSTCGVILVEEGEARMRAIATISGSEDYSIAQKAYPMPLAEFARRRPNFVRVMETRKPTALTDTETELTGELLEFCRAAGIRSNVVVPMLRGDDAIGLIIVNRREPHLTTPDEARLLQSFASQAVIAIENVRLFNETKEALERQTATAEILSVMSSSPTDITPVVDAVAVSAARLCEAADAMVLLKDADQLRYAAHYGEIPIARDIGGTIAVSPGLFAGRVILEGRQFHIHDLQSESRDFPDGSAVARKMGYRTILGTPLMREGSAIGVILVRRREKRPFSEKHVELVKTFADQAVIAIENVRLFREIEEKSAQLEVANKHKSEFLANMSHELRTPLNAIIGFSEVLMDKMFGEVNEKQADYLKDIHESGRHLLSLINDILDLSKIEAGRMELELSRFHLPTAISNAMTLIRERAQRHGIQLGAELDQRLGEFQADERKVKQILLNLLSNAVKFTPDGGRVEVSAKLDTTDVEIAVRDTGIGIAPEDQGTLFEEFKQVGRDSVRKAEGTGLGLALTKKFVELHGGAIRMESSPGKGSTFSFTLPVR